MAEYIEREAAIAALDEFRLNETVSKYATVMQCRAARDAIERATKVIESLPAADVEPVRHGRWVHTDSAAHWYGKDECSECTYHEHDRSDLSHFRYCPNCGAKMDEEVTI